MEMGNVRTYQFRPIRRKYWSDSNVVGEHAEYVHTSDRSEIDTTTLENIWHIYGSSGCLPCKPTIPVLGLCLQETCLCPLGAVHSPIHGSIVCNDKDWGTHQ